MKNNHIVNRLKAGQYSPTRFLRIDRTGWPLESGDAGIAIEAYYQQVALGPRLGQILHMASMQQVEAAVGEHHAPATHAAQVELG